MENQTGNNQTGSDVWNFESSSELNTLVLGTPASIFTLWADSLSDLTTGTQLYWNLKPIEPKNYTFAEQITMLTKVLYEKHGNIELNPTLFQQMIERANPHLKGLFDSLVKALIPNNRSEYNKIEAKKTILEVGLYLSAAGATRTAIDTMNSIGFSACYLTVNNFKRKLVNEHPLKIRKFLSEENDHLYIYNLVDYHDIHKKRRPNTVTLSTVKHMATCIFKQVSACASIPIIFNNTSVHNPKNIDAKCKEECSIKGVRLIGFQEIAPLVADWPGQLFIRKAITNLHKAGSQYSIPAEINSFIPILGPLHISLNTSSDLRIILLDAQNHCELKDTFEKTKAYPYKPSSSKLLTEKMALFLLDYFQEIFKNQVKSKSIKLKKKKTLQYELFTLGETVDLKCLPTGYSANTPPSPDACDHCHKKLDDGEVLICGHEYHFECYQMMEYEEKDEEVPIEENETVEEIETNKSNEIHTKFLNALNNVNTW
ncbi:hypothetical protein C1646_766398 [Rhizophagus diaphanus]|nr:hypothetical protein C1646_766398 [Rhizophagus diaphanus] [Rhizophagus sp. MUCL 43196]